MAKKKTLKELRKREKIKFWDRWQSLRRKPEYKEDVDNFRKTIQRKASSKLNLFNDPALEKDNVKRAYSELSKLFQDIKEKGITKETRSQLNYRFRAKKLPELIEFQNKWGIKFPVHYSVESIPKWLRMHAGLSLSAIEEDSVTLESAFVNVNLMNLKASEIKKGSHMTIEFKKEDIPRSQIMSSIEGIFDNYYPDIDVKQSQLQDLDYLEKIYTAYDLRIKRKMKYREIAEKLYPGEEPESATKKVQQHNTLVEKKIQEIEIL